MRMASPAPPSTDVYQVVPLRRVPAKFSILDYNLGRASDRPNLGEIVAIPFGKSTIQGVVWAKGPSPGTQTFSRKSFTVSKTRQSLTPQQLALARWLTRETLTPPNVVALAMPPGPTQFSGAPQPSRSPIGILAARLEEREKVIESFSKRHTDAGVTFVLIPALPYSEQWLRAFGNTVVLLHGRLTAAQRRKAIQKVAQARVIVSTGVGLGSPLPRIHHLIIDQADDDGYFAFDQAPRVDLRRTAQALGKLHGAALTLLARWQSPTLQGIFPEAQWRGGEATLPLTVIDRTGEPGPERAVNVATALLPKLTPGRTLWLVNRRSEAGRLECQDCGATVACPQCGQVLRVQRERGSLQLHCEKDNLTTAVPEQCANCRGARLTPRGRGVQAVAADLRAHLGGSVATLDAQHPLTSPTATHVVATTAIANELAQRFQRVVLVQTESFLFPGQYRGTEEFFTTLALAQQHLVAEGETFCQTFSADQPILQGNRSAVVAADLLTRSQLHYPPLGTLIVLTPRNGRTNRGAPLPEKLQREASQQWTVTMTPHQWVVRSSNNQRSQLLAFLQHLDPGWQATVDPPDLPA